MKVRKSRTGYWNSPSKTARWLNMTKAADAVFWSAIQMTVQRKMPITERREYAGWKRLTSMVRSRKATSTKEVTISFAFRNARVLGIICIFASIIYKL